MVKKAGVVGLCVVAAVLILPMGSAYWTETLLISGSITTGKWKPAKASDEVVLTGSLPVSATTDLKMVGVVPTLNNSGQNIISSTIEVANPLPADQGVANVTGNLSDGSVPLNLFGPTTKPKMDANSPDAGQIPTVETRESSQAIDRETSDPSECGKGDQTANYASDEKSALETLVKPIRANGPTVDLTGDSSAVPPSPPETTMNDSNLQSTPTLDVPSDGQSVSGPLEKSDAGVIQSSAKDVENSTRR